MIEIIPFVKVPDKQKLFSELAALDKQVQMAYGNSYDTTPWTAAQFSYDLPEKENLSFCVLSENRIIGFSVGYAFNIYWHHISRVAILPDFRGNNLGEKLLSIQLTAMEDSKPQLISIDTKKENKNAVKRYESLNFVIAAGQILQEYVKIRNREAAEYIGQDATHLALLKFLTSSTILPS